MNRVNRRYSDIIFDFGGVLIDWNPRYLYHKFFDGDDPSMERFLNEIGFTEWNLQQDRGRSFAEGTADLCGRFPISKLVPHGGRTLPFPTIWPWRLTTG